MDKNRKTGSLAVSVSDTRGEMGRKAALQVADTMRELAAEKEEINMVFAAAPSQNELLKELTALPGLPWEKVNAFHMDEYIGLPAGAPQSFFAYLQEHIFGKVPFRAVYRLNGSAQNAEEECARYSALLSEHPVDIVCLGVGENGHIAFNDPGAADFCDPALVKVARLDSVCRMQQVHDGCFPTLKDVPERALTLTVPALTAAGAMYCVVPGAAKAKAVRQMLTGEISAACPASVLWLHPCAQLFLDADSASLL